MAESRDAEKIVNNAAQSFDHDEMDGDERSLWDESCPLLNSSSSGSETDARIPTNNSLNGGSDDEAYSDDFLNVTMLYDRYGLVDARSASSGTRSVPLSDDDESNLRIDDKSVPVSESGKHECDSSER